MACTTCKKGPPEVPNMKNCAKCHKTPYCSRECQKTDWKAHKKICGKLAAEGAGAGTSDGVSSGLNPPKGLDGPVEKPFTRLSNRTWLHDRPEKDVYRLLIDVFRMRVEDEYTIEGEITPGTIYDGNANSLPAFRKFMDLVETKPGLLPSWWTRQHRDNCEALGMDDTPSNWQKLKFSIEKHDVIEHYGDSKFPMQLRMFGESMYGKAPGGFDGTAMLAMMAQMETGAHQGHATMMDASAMFRG